MHRCWEATATVKKKEPSPLYSTHKGQQKGKNGCGSLGGCATGFTEDRGLVQRALQTKKKKKGEYVFVGKFDRCAGYSSTSDMQCTMVRACLFCSPSASVSVTIVEKCLHISISCGTWRWRFIRLVSHKRDHIVGYIRDLELLSC